MTPAWRSETKTCARCAVVFGPSVREWKQNWANRKFCTSLCAGLTNAAKATGACVKPCPPRNCVTCGNVIPRGKDEPPVRYAERKYCNRKCMPGRPATALPSRSCVICKTPLERRRYERPNQFCARLTCSPHCESVQRSRSRRRHDFYAVRTSAPQPKSTGITDIAEFLAKHGATKCPTAYAVASTGEISDEERNAHSQRYAELERQRLANVKRRGVSA